MTNNSGLEGTKSSSHGRLELRNRVSRGSLTSKLLERDSSLDVFSYHANREFVACRVKLTRAKQVWRKLDS